MVFCLNKSLKKTFPLTAAHRVFPTTLLYYSILIFINFKAYMHVVQWAPMWWHVWYWVLIMNYSELIRNFRNRKFSKFLIANSRLAKTDYLLHFNSISHKHNRSQLSQRASKTMTCKFDSVVGKPYFERLDLKQHLASNIISCLQEAFMHLTIAL